MSNESEAGLRPDPACAQCERLEIALRAFIENWGARYEGAAAVIADLIDVMEMQEKRESGEFHIRGDVMFSIWSDAKDRARAILNPKPAAGAPKKDP